jgi:hypothetical protein
MESQMIDGHFPDSRNSHVTVNQFAAYLDEESIPAVRLDESSYRFQVQGGIHDDGARVIHPIDVVDQGEGYWSSATPLFRLPVEDTSGTSQILRAALGARGRVSGNAGVFIENDVLMVGADGLCGSPRQIIAQVIDTAQIATPVMEAGLRMAAKVDVQLPWIQGII